MLHNPNYKDFQIVILKNKSVVQTYQTKKGILLSYLGRNCPILTLHPWQSSKTFRKPCGQWIIFKMLQAYFCCIAVSMANVQTNSILKFHQFKLLQLGLTIPHTQGRIILIASIFPSLVFCLHDFQCSTRLATRFSLFLLMN